MRRRFLHWLAMFLFRRAWLMLPLAIVSAVASYHLIDSKLKFDTSLVAFLPNATPREREVREIERDYRNLEPVMAVIHAAKPGEEALLREMTAAFADWLNDRNYFQEPVYRSSELIENYYRSLSNSRLALLLTPDDWETVKGLVKGRLLDALIKQRALRLNAFIPAEARVSAPEDPLGALNGMRDRLARSRGPTRLPVRDRFFLSEDGAAAAILLYPVLATDNARNADRTLRFLENSRDVFFESYPAWKGRAEIEFSGSLVETARNVRRIRSDFASIAKFSLPLIALFLLMVFRKFEAILFVLLPPLVGALWTFALATLLFGGISAVTAVFMAVVGAIGVQFSIHLYHRFTLELYRTRHYYRALRLSYVETARGTFSSALALAVIFFWLFISSLRSAAGLSALVAAAEDPKGLGQLGLMIGLSILCNLAACLTILPLMAAVKSLMARGKIKAVQLYGLKLDRLYEPALQRPQATILTMLLVAVFCGLYSNQLTLAPNFASATPFLYRPQTGETPPLPGGFPLPGRPLIAIVSGPKLEAALEQNDRLYANLREFGDRYGVLSVDSLRTILPSEKSQRAAVAQIDALDLEAFRKDLQASSRVEGFRPQVYAPLIDALEKFKETAANPRFIRLEGGGLDLASAVRRYIVGAQAGDSGKTYFVLTAIYPKSTGFDARQFGAMRSNLSQGIDGLTMIGDPVIERAMAETLKLNLAVMILLSIATILVALFLHFQNARLAWLTFLPIVAETLWICGLMALAGLQIHVFTLMAIPLALGLAMDNSLQLTQYYSDRQPCSVRHVMHSTARATALTCGVIALLYGTLSLMSYQGFREFGLTALIGPAAVFVGCTMLQPALLQAFGKGQSLAQALTMSDEEEQ